MPAISEGHTSDTAILAGAQKCLYQGSRLLTPEATLGAIQDLKQWVAEELAFEEAAAASFGRILSELWHAEYLDQLPPLLNRFERLASAYFVRRGSVRAFQGFCNAWREGVLRRILQFAEEGPDLNETGDPPAPYAFFVSGSLGRREQTLDESDRYVLVWGEAGGANYFEPFAYRVIAILEHNGLIGQEGAFLGKALWRGSLERWESYLEGMAPGSEQPRRLDLLGDLRFLCGDEALGQQVLLQGRACLARSRAGAEAAAIARQVVDAPLALGLLGGIRVEKSGDHAGLCNLESGGLLPLVRAVRLLAAQYPIEPCPTPERIAALERAGVLTRDQADRLTGAYHLLAGLKVRREIALESPYQDPRKLGDEERENVKQSLESVRQLQRVVRCSFLGKDRSSRSEI
jgi:CBS domain-containing protein